MEGIVEGKPIDNLAASAVGREEKPRVLSAGATGTLGQIIDAMLAVDGDSGKHPEYKGAVKTFYAHPVSKGGSSSGHYSKHAETYMNVGEGMGQAMVELLNNN